MGRPPASPESARANRIVTMVTNRELEQLRGLAESQERSLSFVVHQIVARHLAEQIRSTS